MHFTFLVALILTLVGCANTSQRQALDREALSVAIEAAAAGHAKQAAALADSAAAECGPGAAGFSCAYATRLVLYRQFAVLGNSELALTQARSAVALSDRYGDASSQFFALNLLASAAARAHKLDVAEAALARAKQAISDLENGASDADRTSLEAARGTLEGPRALIHLMRGEPAEAAASQRKLIETIQAHQRDDPNLPVELLNLADMYRAAGDKPNATKALQSAISLASALGNAQVEQDALSSLDELTASE